MTVENRPLNICHCIISGGFGGIERQVTSLAEVQRQKHSVRVLTAFPGGVFSDRMSRDGIPVDSLNLRRGLDISPHKVYRAWRIFRSCDLIHIHFFNPVFFIAALLSGKRIVFTFHGIVDIRRQPTIRERIAQKLLKLSIHTFIHEVTTVSEFMRQNVRDFFHYEKPIHITYNIAPQIPDSSEQPQEIRERLGLDKDHFVILHFGRMVQYKGGDRLLRALALIDRQPGNENIRALFIGNGPHLDALKQSARELGVDDRVIFIDFQANIHDYIRMADITALPARNEPFGIAALEVLSLGKVPLVYNDSGGLLEIVTPLTEYNLVADSTEQFVDRILEYRNNHELLEKFRNAAWKRAEDFNAGQVAEGLERIYSNLEGR